MIKYEDDLSLHVTNMPTETSPDAWPPWHPSYCLFLAIFLPFFRANTLPHLRLVELVLITLYVEQKPSLLPASCTAHCLPLAISVTGFSELQLFTFFAPGFCTCWEGKQHKVKALSFYCYPPHSCLHLNVKSHNRSLSETSSYTRSSQRSQKR